MKVAFEQHIKNVRCDEVDDSVVESDPPLGFGI